MQLLFEIIGHLILAGLLFVLAAITIWYFDVVADRVEFLMTSHFVGPKIYGYDYRCECGAHIRKTTKRRPEEVWA